MADKADQSEEEAARKREIPFSFRLTQKVRPGFYCACEKVRQRDFERMGKNPFSRRRSTRKVPVMIQPETSEIEIIPTPKTDDVAVTSAASTSKAKKKIGGARLWMKFDKFGQSELFEWDKIDIIKRVGIPVRDLRILGPVFSHSSNIHGRLAHSLVGRNSSSNPGVVQLLQLCFCLDWSGIQGLDHVA